MGARLGRRLLCENRLLGRFRQRFFRPLFDLLGRRRRWNVLFDEARQTLGNLDHFPNADAAVRLLSDIFPKVLNRVPNAHLVIAGKNPPGELRLLADRPDVTLIAGRHDLRHLFRRAWVSIAPHRVFRGVRTEVLEAMALGVPVVASPQAIEGLDLLVGHDLVMSPDSESMVDDVSKLLTDPIRLDQIGVQGKKSVHNNYSHWNAALRLEELIAEAKVETLVTP